MKNCDNYQQLTPKERTEYIGSLIHACISDERLFRTGEKLIKEAQKKGLFDGVVINPTTEPNNIDL